jgi:hypothetical protein
MLLEMMDVLGLSDSECVHCSNETFYVSQCFGVRSEPCAPTSVPVIQSW